MRVFKATNADMTCHMGKGKFQYVLGVPATAESSKCADTGLHACEYVLDCTGYYRLGTGNRFFVAEAEGDIAEDGTDTRIACTKLTLLEELDNKMIAREAMLFMMRHPRRENWKKSRNLLMVAADEAYMDQKDGIAIARGREPRVKGCAGAHIGWIREVAGEIVGAYLLTVQGPIKPDTWYTIETAHDALRKEYEDET